jgi:hypothetical protein
MPFPTTLTAGQLANLRGSTYRSETHLAYCPQTTVFRCRPSVAVTSRVFGQFNYNSVDVGAFGAVKVGQRVYITATTSLVRPLFVGRVRKAPTSSIFYIDECPLPLLTSYYVTVVNDYDLTRKLARVVNGVELVDWDNTYTAPAPLIGNLQSAYVSLPNATASFSFAPTGTPVVSGGTITGWLWDVADGTITVGTSTTQNITASFPPGHRWVRVTATNSAGVSNYFVFEVYVGDARVIYNVGDVSVEASIENGYSASITMYRTDPGAAALAALRDNTRVTLFSVERFADGTSAPLFTNILMVGRLRSETMETDADTQSVRYQIEGFGAQMAAISSQQVLLTRATVAALWGQFVNLTPGRAAAHFATAYSTLSNVCALSIPMLDAYFIKDLQIQATTIAQAMEDCAKYVLHVIQHAPSGEIAMAPDALYAGSSIVVAVLDAADMLSLTIDREYAPFVGQVEIGAEGFTTASNVRNYYTASAPPTALGNGDEVETLDGLYLKHSQTDAQWRSELAGICAVFYSTRGEAETITLRTWGAWQGALVPMLDRWYRFSIVPADNARQISYANTLNWQCVSVSQTWSNENAVREVEATFRLQPPTGNAQIAVQLIPPAQPFVLPALPPLPPYPAFPELPTINYPDDSVQDDEVQPVDGSSAAQAYYQGNSNAAADLANSSPPPNCRIVKINMARSTPYSTPFIPLNGKPYTVTVRGAGLIQPPVVGGWTYSLDFTVTSGAGWAPFSLGNNFACAQYLTGVGWQTLQAQYTPNFPLRRVRGVSIRAVSVGTGTITSITLTFTRTVGTFNPAITSYVDRLGNTERNCSIGTSPWTTTEAIPYVPGTLLFMRLLSGVSANFGGDPGGQVTLTGITVNGIGQNFFTGASSPTPTPARYSDAFYEFDENGGDVTIAQPTRGLEVDGALPALPAYNADHQYTLSYVGDGSSIELLYRDTTHSDNDGTLYYQICSQDNTGVP